MSTEKDTCQKIWYQCNIPKKKLRSVGKCPHCRIAPDPDPDDWFNDDDEKSAL